MMTGKIDTSAAAVEILARDVCDRQRMRVFGGAITKSSAEIMRALAAERDALRAEVERLRKNEAAIRADERAKVIAEAVKVAEAQGIACSQFFRDHQKSPNVYEQLDIVADDLRSLAALKGGDA